MAEIIKDIVALIGLDKKVLIPYRLWVDLWDMGKDVNAVGYLTGFPNLEQSCFWYVRPNGCDAMQMSTL